MLVNYNKQWSRNGHTNVSWKIKIKHEEIKIEKFHTVSIGSDMNQITC